VSALLATVLASSLVGSVHCAAMCGPLQGLYLDASLAGGARWRRPLAHAGGRLGAYVTLGAIAGGVGAAVDLAGSLGDVQRAAMIVAGAMLVAWGAMALASALGAPVPSLSSLRPRVFQRGVVQIRRRRPTVRAALLGLLSAALPCGWLWAFVVVAAGTGSVLAGALVMSTFWLGTVPMMVGLGAFAAPIVRRIGARLPFVTAAALIAMGIFALQARVPMLHAGATRADSAGGVPTEPACHADGAAP
jgi:sulfite exporter TauE/SafE